MYIAHIYSGYCVEFSLYTTLYAVWTESFAGSSNSDSDPYNIYPF